MLYFYIFDNQNGMYNKMLKDKIEAGLLLSEKLKKYQNSNTFVLAVPWGGVTVGFVTAKSLHLPLDIAISKKIGQSYNEEFAIGALWMDSMILDEHPNIPKEYIETVKLRKLMQDNYALYMGQRKPVDIKRKNVILKDDGIATGNTLLASIEMLRKRNLVK